jgi:hypothetical protein
MGRTTFGVGKRHMTSKNVDRPNSNINKTGGSGNTIWTAVGKSMLGVDDVNLCCRNLMMLMIS